MLRDKAVVAVEVVQGLKSEIAAVMRLWSKIVTTRRRTGKQEGKRKDDGLEELPVRELVW